MKRPRLDRFTACAAPFNAMQVASRHGKQN